MVLRISLLIGFAISLWTCGAEPLPLTADEVVARLLERSRSTPERIAAQRHCCIRNSVIEERDGRGDLKEHVAREFEVELRGDQQRLRLLQMNGKVPTEREAKREVEHEAEVRKDYAERKGRSRSKSPDFLDESILGRYAYHMVGIQTNDGRACYVLQFEPKNKSGGRDIQDRALNLLAGKIWVDAEEFELAGVDAKLVDRLEVLAGILGDLERLDFTLDRCRLPDGFWFNRTLKMRFEGRKLLSHFRVSSVIEQRDFKRLPSESTTSEAPSLPTQRASR